VTPSFVERYGPWAVVAGASEGLGAAFAHALAARGLHLVLLARRAELLAAVAEQIRRDQGVEVRVVAVDLADTALVERLVAATDGLAVGLAVYNAAYSYLGPLLDRPLDDALRVVEVNVRAPLRFVHTLAPAMVARGRGGVVLMSSLAGFQGSPRLAAYAASKAFNLVLGESLWAELKPRGVDVLVSCAGAVRTPNYLATAGREAPGILDAAAVAGLTLDALGRGPVVVPGGVNKLARFFLGRLLSRRGAVGVMQRSTADLQ
jgi:short-subunit dehydrogenase